MAHNEALTQRVRAALSHLPDVEEKRMFRGTAFMVDGKMCITTGHDGLMCRIDPDLYDSVIEQNAARPVEMNGRIYKGYVRIDEGGISNQKDFEYWINLSLDFNKRAKASKKRKKA